MKYLFTCIVIPSHQSLYARIIAHPNIVLDFHLPLISLTPFMDWLIGSNMYLHIKKYRSTFGRFPPFKIPL